MKSPALEPGAGCGPQVQGRSATGTAVARVTPTASRQAGSPRVQRGGLRGVREADRLLTSGLRQGGSAPHSDRDATAVAARAPPPPPAAGCMLGSSSSSMRAGCHFRRRRRQPGSPGASLGCKEAPTPLGVPALPRSRGGRRTNCSRHLPLPGASGGVLTPRRRTAPGSVPRRKLREAMGIGQSGAGRGGSRRFREGRGGAEERGGGGGGGRNARVLLGCEDLAGSS